MHRVLASLCVSLVLSVPPAFAQTTSIVDDDGRGTAVNCDDATAAFTTVAAAIAATVAGGSVLVCPGTYGESIDFGGKAISVRSIHGPAVTTLDGNLTDSVVTFASGETATSLLQGFTLQNGRANLSSPSFGDGGGIRIHNSSPSIRGNIIIGNRACTGPGISVRSGSPVIEENTIANNSQAGCGGGTGGAGIGIVGDSTAVVRRNYIVNNTIGAAGGGISLFAAGAVTIEFNVIAANTASIGGGIWIVNQSSAKIVGNLIVRNQAREGGGVYWSPGGGGLRLGNNTIAFNDSPKGSGVLAAGFDAGAALYNNAIIAAAGQTAVHCGDFNDLTAPLLRSNNVFSATGTSYGGTCGNPTGTNGNISADPLFAHPAADDFHLLPGSPNIDAGDNTAPSLPSVDLDGHARVLGANGGGAAVVDIGADEAPTGGPVENLPGTFSKTSPADGALDQAIPVALTWGESAGATGYEYCIDMIDNGACDGRWVYGWDETHAAATGLLGQTTHYWLVRAHNAVGTTYANGKSADWSFTTHLAPGTRLLEVSGSLMLGTGTLGSSLWIGHFTIHNNGDSPLTVTGITYPTGFSGAWSGIIPAGDSQRVTVTFAATVPGSYGGTVTIVADQTSGSGTLTASATAVCGYTLSQRSLTVGSRLSPAFTYVNTAPACSWSARSEASWILVEGRGNVFGPGYLSLTVTPNMTDVERVGTVLVGNQALIVRQTVPPARRLWWQHTAEGILSVWNMRGTRLASSGGLTPSRVGDSSWRIAGTADFNGDGHVDLFWQNQQAGAITVWLMNGNTFVAAGILSPMTVSDSRWAVRAIADMNRDGKPDIVWHHEVEGWLSVWLMDGLTMKEGRAIASKVDPTWLIVGTSDLNHDGMTDLVWQNGTTGVITSWLMNDTTFDRAGLISPAAVTDTGWKIRAVYDVDGDSLPDFLWHHQGTGALAVWYMNGTTLVSGSALNPDAVSPAWQIVGGR